MVESGPFLDFIGVQIPTALVDSLRAGRCVIFAGAGVSMYAPANLPSFWSLAKELTGAEPTEPLDRYLGTQPNPSDLKRRTCEAIARAKDHTPIHKALNELFPNVGSVRVVTTNYDLLLEQAGVETFGIEPTPFHAPALPLGRDFEGIVHVQGSIKHEKNIVLTDADFGAAYLVDGWARRFLSELFQSWDILFVGYSHDDTVMTYLARALPPTSAQRRFAFDLDPNTDKVSAWHHLGIAPISYGDAANDHDHSQQVLAIQSLSDYIHRSALEWAKTLAQAVKDGPPGDIAFSTHLEHALHDEVQCRSFLEQKPDGKWTGWLDDHGFISPLFGEASLSSSLQRIGHWLAHKILQENPEVVLSLLEKYQGCDCMFWRKLSRGLLDLSAETDKALASKLLGLAVSLMPQNPDPHCLRWISEACGRFQCREPLLAAFKASVRATVKFEKPWSKDDSVRIRPTLRSHQHHLVW